MHLLEKPEHQIYAREALRLLPEKSRIMKQAHQSSYDPFDTYLIDSKVQEYINRYTMSTASKSKKTTPKKQRATLKSPPHPNGVGSMTSLTIAIEEIGTTAALPPRLVSSDEANMKFNFKEGTTFIMGHMVDCVFDYKVDVATNTQYRVNKLMLQVPSNSITCKVRFGNESCAELVRVPTKDGSVKYGYLITLPVNIEPYFAAQGKINEINTKRWGKETASLVNRTAAAHVAFMREVGQADEVYA
jgi:hypothetical protein